MKVIRKVLLLYEQKLLSTREISRSLDLPRATVSDYIQRYKRSHLTPDDIPSLSDREIYERLFKTPGLRRKHRSDHLPDFAYIHQELRRPHVTRQLLWEEYRERCPEGLSYSQFCQRYKDYSKQISISMRQTHKAGEKLFLDYAGSKIPYTDPQTGILHYASVFTAVLGASGYTYAEATQDEKKRSFISATIHSFHYMGGVTGVLVPDNTKAAVTTPAYYDPDINKTYQDMADHYGCVVIPARPRRPKDKSKVELGVCLVQRWILARMRNRHFTSIAEINENIDELLVLLNDKKIRHVGKSRYELYLELDKPSLASLPPDDYVLREIKACRVNIDYHIQLDGCFYSVPYQLAHKEVWVYYTAQSVDIYYENKRVAFHKRLYHKGSASTLKEHMASSHRIYAEFSPSRLIAWGSQYGKSMKELIEQILVSRTHPELGYRTCLGILTHAKTVKEPKILELTAQKMLELKSYRVKHFKEILKNKSYIVRETEEDLPLPPVHKNLRNPSSYR
jgi:transposase